MQTETKIEKKPFMTVPELAMLTGLPENTIRRWCDDGKFHVVLSGNRRYINVIDFERFVGGLGRNRAAD